MGAFAFNFIFYLHTNNNNNNNEQQTKINQMNNDAYERLIFFFFKFLEIFSVFNNEKIKKHQRQIRE